MSGRFWLGSWVLVCVLLTGRGAIGDVVLPPLFNDHMVLQQKAKVPMWGKASPGEKVTVTMLSSRAETTADAEGRWRLEIGPLTVGGPYEMTVAGKNTIKLTDVLVGEVWVCSGQSNMDWPVKRSQNAEQELALANQLMIRFFGVEQAICDQPEKELTGTWQRCTPDTAAGFSAVGYFFAKELRRKIKVPVGLIQASLGSTPAEAWISRKGLESDPELSKIIPEWNAFQAAKAASSPASGPAASAPASQPVTSAPTTQVANAFPKNRTSRKEGHRRAPTVLFNGMIYPLIPYRIAGVLWYQGEANVGQAERYRKLFPALIKDWREQWGQGDLPFFFVQLPNYGERRGVPMESAWAELRETQTAALKLPKTGMVVTIDIGEADNIHPANKYEVGLRLALVAEAIAYDKRVAYTGPIYHSYKVEGDHIRIYFQSIGNALGGRERQPLMGFTIAGEDRQFYWADAVVENGTVVVHSEQVSKPVAVRYAWADNPECNLIGVFQLPAGPFRTDDWPIGSAKSRRD